MWSPGGTLVIDIDIVNRIFLTVNGGYRSYSNFRYDANNANAIIDDTIQAGAGINVRLTDSWAILGEAWHEGVRTAYLKNSLQNPAEFVAGARWTPQKHARGLAITAGGGRGITTGIGSPDWRGFVGVNYRRPAVVSLPPPPPPAEVEVRVEEKIVITQKIHFEFDKAVIRKLSYPILDDVAYLLSINPQIRQVSVEGHTDWIGPDKYNQKLSERRANSVRDYLISKGIEPDRLHAVGYGESRPIADNNSSRGRARNRRTEFMVVQ
ncbi:MAG: OmpA family protein [Deltaproteobacteria bacterium]|nr:OmpA family protein [Deltaproteobacteria bacterium]